MPRTTRLAAPAVVGAIVTTLLLVVGAATASAHVTVSPEEAEQGGYVALTFRVPNERPDASTTSVAVQLPTDHPLASVSVRPLPGWTYSAPEAPLPTPIKTDDGDVTEAVSQVTWTGGSIGPGEFQEFEISVGPLPDDVDTLSFPTVQTYSNGEVVRWIETASAGAAEPEHPAPQLELTAAAAEGAATSATGAGTSAGSSDTAAEAAPTDADDDDDGIDGLAVTALVVGGLGLIAAVVALVLARRR